MGCDFETTFAVEVVCPMHIDSLGSVLKQICGVQAEGVRRARWHLVGAESQTEVWVVTEGSFRLGHSLLFVEGYPNFACRRYESSIFVQ